MKNKGTVFIEHIEKHLREIEKNNNWGSNNWGQA